MKKLLVFSLLFINISTTVLADVISVTTINSLNNSDESSSTYKTSEDYIKDVSIKLNHKSDKVEINNYDTEIDLKDLSKEVSYLVENKILSRDINIQSSLTGIKVYNSIDLITNYKEEQPINKSELLMALSKALYGIQESRPIVLNKKNTKEPVADGDNIYDYSNGEYNVYVTPNVYELYFKLLLDKSLIDINDFESNDFVNDYNRFGTIIEGSKYYPAWYNNNMPYDVFKTPSHSSSVSVLGESFEIEDYRPSSVLEKFNTKVIKPKYFKDEEISSIEALTIIEDFLRLTEKDMTNTEAELINYKYGADYLNKLDDSTRTTVMFLVAKGILDFEDETEFANLFDSFKNDFFYELLYRVHNKDARKTFSEIQLTDEDNYFLSKGYYKKGIKISDSDEFPMTETEVSEGPVVLGERLLVTNGNARVVHHQPYIVSRSYYDTASYTYKGLPLKDLKVGNPKEVTSIEDLKSSDGKVLGKKITFEVSATTPQNAIAMIDARTTVKTASGDTIANISGIASSKTKDGKEEFFISKSTLNSILIEVTTYGGRKESEKIQAIDDKYLVNTRTGTRAVLLENNKTVLIGNEIITNEENIVQGIAGETYYNLAIIVKLMSNAYVDKLDPAHVYSTKGVKYQGIVSVYGEASGHQLDKTTIAQFDEMRGSNDSIVSKKMYSLQDTDNMFSILYKDVSKDFKQEKGSTVMVVEWRYIFPENGDEDIKKYNSLYKDRDMSVSEMGNFLFKRPDNDELAKWWDSNIGISNAICNNMYGTTGQQYINSGYLTPKISFLSAKGELDVTAARDFVNKLEVSAEYRERFLRGKSLWESIFNNGGDGHIYGQLGTNRYVSTRSGSARKGDDNLKFTPYTDCGEYAITSNGVVYKDIEESNMKYKGKLGSSGGDYLELDNKQSRKVVTVLKDTYYNLAIKNSHPLFQGEFKAQDIVRIGIGDLYHKMAPTNYVEVTMPRGDTDNAKPKDLKVSINTVNNTQKDLLSYYEEDILSTSNKDVVGIPMDVADLIVRVDEDKFPQEPFLYYSYDEVRKAFAVFEWKKSGDKYKGFPVTNTSNLVGYGEQVKVRVYPAIYLKKFKVGPSGGNTLVEQDAISFFERENVMLTGINTSVMDSIVANSYKYTPSSKLRSGDRVIIGDINFVYNGEYLVSEPIQDRNFNSSNISVDLQKPENEKSLVSKRFMDIGISIYHNGYLVKGQSFADYILEGSGFGEPTKEQDSNKLKNCLIKKSNGNLVISNNGKETPYQVGTFMEQFVMKIRLSDDILFRPTEHNSRTFVLVQITNSGSDGYLSKSPFFNETLSYTWDSAIFGRISQTKYQEALDSQNLIQKYLDQFKFEKTQSFKALLGQWTVAILSYLIVVNWISLAIKKIVTLRVVLEQIKRPTTGENGPDVMKLLTFGMRDIDSDDKLLTIVGVTFLMFCIIIITLNVV